MRTTFFEKRLFNYASQKHDISFILNGKEWGEGKLERERERGRMGRVWEAESSGERVAPWVINLTVVKYL